MINITVTLLLIVLVALLTGLIKPSIVIYWGKRTRKQVLITYGFAILVVFVSLGFMLPSTDGTTKSSAPEQHKSENAKWTSGSLLYNVECSGSNDAGVKLFKSFSPESIRIYFAGDTFVMQEKGGFDAHIFADSNYKRVYFIKANSISRGHCTNMETEFNNPDMQNLMPYHYRAKLEPAKQDTVICGYPCSKFIVSKSGFVRSYAKAEVWISKEVLLPQLRFDFQSRENIRTLSPLPLQLGIDNGTILRMRVDEDNVIVTYTVAEINRNRPNKSVIKLPK